MASLAASTVRVDCPICPAAVEIPVRDRGIDVHAGEGPAGAVVNLSLDMQPWRDHIAAAHTATRGTS
jgi:hypothetical protein